MTVRVSYQRIVKTEVEVDDIFRSIESLASEGDEISEEMLEVLKLNVIDKIEPHISTFDICTLETEDGNIISEW